jgi:N,N'-diacetyllegionaminate synthase
MNIGAARVDSGVYVIAELGVNHDGSVARAIELVEAASQAGADAIKLQYFETDRLMSSSAKLAAYQRVAGERDPISMLRRLELSIDDMAKVVARARERRVHAIVTVFSVELVERAERLEVDAYKTASPDVVHRPLLAALARTGRPLIVSTGAAELEEVRATVRWLGAMPDARSSIALLQCVSAYPTPRDRAAIGAMADLRRVFSGPIGYSDHTTEVDTGSLAVALGATILEKHLTYDQAATGPDHAASLDAAGMTEYVRLAKAAASTRVEPGELADERVGDHVKRVQDCEMEVRRVSRQSVVAARGLPAGQRLTADDLTIKRPGTGIGAMDIARLIGMRVTRDVEADTVMTWDDVAGDAQSQ